MNISPATARMSARAQQLLLAHGATYPSYVAEASWQIAPVVLDVPEASSVAGLPRLPGGRWLLLPWDAAQPELLEQLLDTMTTGGMPDAIVLITSLGHVNNDWLAGLSRRYNAAFAAIEVATHRIAGPTTFATGLAPLFSDNGGAIFHNIDPRAHVAHLANSRDPAIFIERLIAATPTTWATHILMALNIGIYVIMLLTNGFDLFGGFTGLELVNWGANVSSLTLGDSQWWRLLSCTFVHANLIHIGVNMWALRALGDMTERLFGTAWFVVLYLLAGLGGSIASLGFTLAERPMLPSIGASGAVFGIMGGVLGFALSRGKSMPKHLKTSLIKNAVSFIGLNLMIGLSMPAIDNAAHMGGLATGVLAGVLLSRDLPPAPQPAPMVRLLAVVLVCIALGLGISAL